MTRIRSIVLVEGFHARVGFTDGTERTIDLAPFLRGPIFEPLKRDRALFESVRVDHELGTIVWANGADVDPDVLYEGYTPAAWQNQPAADAR